MNKITYIILYSIMLLPSSKTNASEPRIPDNCHYVSAQFRKQFNNQKTETPPIDKKTKRPMTPFKKIKQKILQRKN